MIVPSPYFLLFAAVCALAFNANPAFQWRQGVLLAANFLFLTSFSQRLTEFLPFAGFLALGYTAQRTTRNGSRRSLFPVLLIMTIAAFFWLKRYSFFPDKAFLPFPYVLIGLSYVFFRVVHLIIDSHQGALETPVGPLSYLNYVLNFTSLTSGPIQRYQDYHAMETAPLPLSLTIAGRALERLVVGYFKVAILSMLLSQGQHQALDALAASHTLEERIWLGARIVALYPLYLYCNFSGYVDVVIGVARFFRLVLPENFDRPFAAGNFLDFWSHWHMTLSNWLKTYVYNPLMLTLMSRVTQPSLAPFLSVFAFFVTFFLVGIWHGQTSVFVMFGFLQGLGVSGTKLYQILMTRRLGKASFRKVAAQPIYHALARGLTFTWFAFTLIFFWANWSQIFALGDSLGWSAAAGAAGTIMATATVALSLWESVRAWVLTTSPDLVTSRYVRTAQTTALVLITTAVAVLLNAPAPDIVYKAF